MLWNLGGSDDSRLCLVVSGCESKQFLKRSKCLFYYTGWIIYCFVSTWCRRRDICVGHHGGPTYRSRLLCGYLPPPSPLNVILRLPHSKAAVSRERSANLSFSLLIISREREDKYSLRHFRTVSPNFQWDQTTEASLLHLFNPEPLQPWTVARLVWRASCCLDVYASRCCGSCN